MVASGTAVHVVTGSPKTTGRTGEPRCNPTASGTGAMRAH